MAPIQERNVIVKKLIRTALGDHDLEDEEMLERAQMCATAAMSIISTLKDNEVFEEAIAKFSANDQVVQRGDHVRRSTETRTPQILLVAKELERRDKLSRQ